MGTARGVSSSPEWAAAASRAPRGPFGDLQLGLDLDHDRGAHRAVVDPEGGHLQESDTQLAQTRSNDHRDPGRGEVIRTLSLAQA
ncbi:MAG: hypothetical protein EA388_11570 [Nitriliruptor sp.]|nr:MAG: hypothetical protein EA388_11570 [Nitriliruptor sp.]